MHRRSASGDCSTDQRKALGPDTQQTLRKVNASFFHPYCSARRDDVVGTFSLAQNFFALSGVTLGILCFVFVNSVLFRFTPPKFRARGKAAGKMLRFATKVCHTSGYDLPPSPFYSLHTTEL